MDQATARRGALAFIVTLFFAWGFTTATIDPLIPAVKSIFNLSLRESQLTQFAFFTAYGVVSIPAGVVVGRLGKVTSIIVALLVMAAGCCAMPLATHALSYPMMLGALFVIGGGLAMLQVAANPLAAELGPTETSHFRLNLAQAFNSLGTVLAPLLGAAVMLRGGLFAKGALVTKASRTASLRNIDTSFLIIAGMLVLLSLAVWFMRRPIQASSRPESGPRTPGSVWKPLLRAFRSSWALLGAAAIFLYVGAEVCIGSFMINFLQQPTILGIDAAHASTLLSRYWLGAMIGRLAGSWLLTRVKASSLLTGAAAIAALLCGVTALSGGGMAATAVLSIGLFNSIMFPTIFTLTLERSSAPAESTSGLLCMAIVGGAVLPLLMGQIADRSSLSAAFVVPLIAYLGVVGFAAASRRAPATAAVPGLAALH